MFKLENSFLLDDQIRMVLRLYFNNYYKETSEYFQFRCNVCGDDKYNKRIKKAYILKKGNDRIYYCHHASCGYVKPATYWMKEFFPTFYKEYILNLYKGSSLKNNENSLPIIEKEKYNEKEDVKYFMPILKGEGKLFEDAKNICISRMIPKDIWKYWCVATGGTFKNRLIIPYFNGKKIYNWQARAIYDYQPIKYISRKGDDLNNIYNFYGVDKSKPVVVLEGVIDSLFVKNSIAISGAKKNKNDLIEQIPYKYFMMDGGIDKGGKETSLKLLQRGEYVFSWKSFCLDFNISLKQKLDVNNVVLFLNKPEGFNFKELEKYFTNSVYRKIEFI